MTVLVACLCAAWCRTCDAYVETFQHLRTEFPTARFVWVDVEDHAALLDDLDVVDFPTLVIASGDRPLFAGPVLPQPAVASQLIRTALAGGLSGTASMPPSVLHGLQQLAAVDAA
ncbi:thioredoxin family protein [Rubrivivax albus]|uniref:thioredoxin family protein n=1 Tax=Rubrivivax albus TaxID=2499835 RepID=UPI001E64F0B3|nr:thioredoxin family protein [Rubrivivax albus]